jgi:predicted DNA-binding antitoxin AbrB/MazE fold protein
MITNLKAIYENVLRLKEPLSLPDGAQVDVTVVSHEEDNGERSQGMEDQSWDALAQRI